MTRLIVAIAMTIAIAGLSRPVMAAAPLPTPANEYYVAPDGKDVNPGTKTAPFATLERARDAVRDLRKAAPAGGITVWLRGGTYAIKQTLEFTDADSGTAAAPIRYRACPGETVRLMAGRVITAADCKPLTDPAILKRLDPAARGNVVRVDLATLGVQHTGPWADLFHNGAGTVGLFADGKRMPIARWPNEGYTTMGKVIDKGDLTAGPGKRGGTFVYRDDRPSRWQVDDGVWLDGFWRVPWAPETVRVQSIDTAKREIKLAAAVNAGIGSKYTGAEGSGKEPWYAVNVLEELDQPGEWVLRSKEKAIYFWPPAPVAKAEIFLTDMATPVIRAKGTSYVTLRGLTLEGGMGHGIEIAGGTGFLVAACTVRNIDGTAILVRGGKDCGVVACDLYDLGRGGIYLAGGDRKTLTPAGHYTLNNHIYHVGQIQKTYAPPIEVGCYATGYAAGCRVAHNLIHDCPHAGVLYGGNDNVFEYNEIHDIALDSGDVGAFYTWNDWTSRGNIVRYNFFHHSPKANGVYCDDGDSGDTIVGNIFWQMQCGPFIGGGHDNIVRNNIILDCPKAIHVDSRGVERNYNLQNKKMVEAVTSVNPSQPPWSTKYPELAKLLESHPELPTGNVVETNVVARCVKMVNLGGKPENFKFMTVGQNLDLGQADPGFIAMDKMDLRLRPDSPIFAKLPGFKPIPFEKIGLYVDEYRPTLPADIRKSPAPMKPGEVFHSETDLNQSNKKPAGR